MGVVALPSHETIECLSLTLLYGGRHVGVHIQCHAHRAMYHQERHDTCMDALTRQPREAVPQVVVSNDREHRLPQERTELMPQKRWIPFIGEPPCSGNTRSLSCRASPRESRSSSWR